MFSLRLTGISLGYFMVLLDTTVLNVALPDVRRSLGGTVAGQQWTVTAYTVAFAALLLSSGAIADRFGAARVFRLGVLAFAFTSLLCAFAPSLWLLVLFRALQGAAAAAIPSSTLSLLGELYPAPAERARAVGLWAGASGLGFAAGPLLGGPLVELGGWRAVFLLNLPFAVAALAFTGRTAPSATTGRTLDRRSQFLAAATLALASAALIEGAGSPSLAVLLGFSALLTGAALVAAERRSPAPAFPPRLLAVPEIRRVLGMGAALQFQLVGPLFVFALYFAEHRRYSAALSGLAFLPLALAPSLSPVAGRLAARFGASRVMKAGLVLGVVGDLLTAAAILADVPYPLLCPALVLMGLSTPLILIPLTTRLIAASPAGAAGMAGGLFNAARQIGGTLAVAFLGGLFALAGPGEGTAWSLLATASVLLAALLAGPDVRSPSAGPRVVEEVVGDPPQGLRGHVREGREGRGQADRP